MPSTSRSRRSSVIQSDRLPVDHLEDHLVDVHGVSVGGEVVELPDLGVADAAGSPSRRASTRDCIADPVGVSTVPSMAAAGPRPSRIGDHRHHLEQSQRPRPDRRRQRRQRRQHEELGRRRRIGSQRRPDAELHDLPGGVGIGEIEVRRPARRRRTARRGRGCRGRSCPTGTLVKSTITSARSARPISSWLPRPVMLTGAARKPPSLPICQTSTPGIVGEVEDQEARLAAVEEAEAVAPLLDVQERPGVAVHHDRVAEELRVPDRRDVGVRGCTGPGRRRRRTRASPDRTASRRR